MLLNDNIQIVLTKFTVNELFVHAVLSTYGSNLLLLRIDNLLLVIPLLDQVFVDDSYCGGRHLLLLLLASCGELVNHLLITVLELLVVLNFRFLVANDFLLDIIAHGQVAHVVD